MANDNKQIAEVTVTVGDQRINISDAGIWVDLLDSSGEVQSSFAKAWEELNETEVQVYADLLPPDVSVRVLARYEANTEYQLVTRISVPWLDADLPALKVG